MITSASDLAKKEENFSTVGASRTCSNRRSRKDKYGYYTFIITVGSVCVKT